MSLNEKTNGLLKTVLILIILEVLYELGDIAKTGKKNVS